MACLSYYFVENIANAMIHWLIEVQKTRKACQHTVIDLKCKLAFGLGSKIEKKAILRIYEQMSAHKNTYHVTAGHFSQSGACFYS